MISLASAQTVTNCPPPTGATSVAGILRQRARMQADDPAFAFLGFGHEDDLNLTYGELDRRADAVATLLRSHGIGAGERVLLLYPSARDFIEAFFGCLYAGVVAVPALLPDDEKEQRRLISILKDALPRAALCRDDDDTGLRAYLAGHGFTDVQCLATTRLPLAAATADLPPLGPEDLAFLQYTSGSTSTPKGVMVAHGNLLSNLDLIKTQVRAEEGRCLLVSWLPHFHDMGLIGGILHPLHVGRPVILFSVLSFLQQPMRWLKIISDYGVTHAAAPNFAYELCLKRSRRIPVEQLDFSRWRMAFSGAEPIRYETLVRFAEHFGPAGFHPDSFTPGYGLAEGTLMVTSKRMGQVTHTRKLDYQALVEGRSEPAKAGQRALDLVACGNVGETSMLVRICDTESGKPLPANQVGEICIQGDSVCQGYYGQEEASLQTFRAYPQHFGPRGALRTGDLGFVDDDGQLFITGRLKDVVICHGANHYPQDLELLIEHTDHRIREGRLAVFNLTAEAEAGTFAVCEVANQTSHPAEWDEQAGNLIEAVRQGSGVQLTGMIFIRKGEIPKTSSGKIQRRECRQRYLEGRLGVLHEKILPPWGERIQRIRGGGAISEAIASLVV